MKNFQVHAETKAQAETLYIWQLRLEFTDDFSPTKCPGYFAFAEQRELSERSSCRSIYSCNQDKRLTLVDWDTFHNWVHQNHKKIGYRLRYEHRYNSGQIARYGALEESQLAEKHPENRCHFMVGSQAEIEYGHQLPIWFYEVWAEVTTELRKPIAAFILSVGLESLTLSELEALNKVIVPILNRLK